MSVYESFRRSSNCQECGAFCRDGLKFCDRCAFNCMRPHKKRNPNELSTFSEFERLERKRGRY